MARTIVVSPEYPDTNLYGWFKLLQRQEDIATLNRGGYMLDVMFRPLQTKQLVVAAHEFAVFSVFNENGRAERTIKYSAMIAGCIIRPDDPNGQIRPLNVEDMFPSVVLFNDKYRIAPEHLTLRGESGSVFGKMAVTCWIWYEAVNRGVSSPLREIMQKYEIDRDPWEYFEREELARQYRQQLDELTTPPKRRVIRLRKKR